VSDWNDLEFENRRALAIVPIGRGMHYDPTMATRIGEETAKGKPLHFVIYILHSEMDRADVRD
jgi:hypothetical protein